MSTTLVWTSSYYLPAILAPPSPPGRVYSNQSAMEAANIALKSLILINGARCRGNPDVSARLAPKDRADFTRLGNHQIPKHGRPLIQNHLKIATVVLGDICAPEEGEMVDLLTFR